MRNSKRFKKLVEEYGLDVSYYTVGRINYATIGLPSTSLSRVVSLLWSLTDNRIIFKSNRGPTSALIIFNIADLNELEEGVIEEMVIALALEEVM